MKRVLLFTLTVLLLSCGTSSKTVEEPPQKDYMLDLSKLPSYLGKSYEQIKNDFKGYTSTTNTDMGDVTLKVFALDNNAPIKTLSCEFIETNKVIKKIFLTATYIDFTTKRESLVYFHNKITSFKPITSIWYLNNADDIRPYSGTIDTFFSFLRENANYGGYLIYRGGNYELGVTTFAKGSPHFAISFDLK